MTKTKNIAIAATLTGVAAVTAFLLVPHTVTVKERISEPVDGVKMKTSYVKTSLLESLTNPKKVTVSDKDGATFTGITDEDGSYIKDGTPRNVLTSKTVYADYKPVLYDATYTVDGKNYLTTSFKAGNEPSIPSSEELASTHPYEDFVEWKKVGNDNPKLAETGSDKSVTYEAVFTGKTYKITYDLDGGSADNPDSYQYGAGVESFNDASKSGYTFDGWYSDAEKTNKVTSLDKNAHDDITLYAKFNENPKPVVKQKTVSRQSYSSSNSKRTYSNNSENASRSAANGSSNNGSAGNSSANSSSAQTSTPAPVQPSEAPVSSEPAAPASTPAPSNGPTFDHMGEYGGLWLDSGYQVALATWHQSNVNAKWTAAYDPGYINGVESMADHKNGTPALLPAMQQSNTMVIRYADGTERTLHKKYTVECSNWSMKTSDGHYVYDPDYVASFGADFVCQTCYTNSTNLMTFWG